nr:ABC transporter substrate-binding protein [Oscillospiraceae bacterium]
MKKLLAILLAVLMIAGLCACGSSGGEKTPSEPAKTDAKYKVGICQLVQHVALDAATQGFKDALTEKLGADAVTFDYQDASGDSANCSVIVNGFVSDKVDLIMCNATAPLQAAA